LSQFKGRPFFVSTTYPPRSPSVDQGLATVSAVGFSVAFAIMAFRRIA